MKIIDVKMQPFFDEEIQVTAKLENGEEEFLFGFSPKEISISKAELIGKTIDEAFALYDKKSQEYLEKNDSHWSSVAMKGGAF